MFAFFLIILIGEGSITDRGNSANEMGDYIPIADLGSGRTVLQVDGGTRHMCAILDNLQVKCWGNGQYGRTGFIVVESREFVFGSSDIFYVLGYGDELHRGDDASEMGDYLGTVNLGVFSLTLSFLKILHFFYFKDHFSQHQLFTLEVSIAVLP